MNPRLLTSAVAIHATACIVAFLAVGPGQAGANPRGAADSSFLQIDSFSNSTQAPDDSLFESDMSEQEWAKTLPVLEIPELPANDRFDRDSASNHSASDRD
jgi:hypothetical protein